MRNGIESRYDPPVPLLGEGRKVVVILLTVLLVLSALLFVYIATDTDVEHEPSPSERLEDPSQSGEIVPNNRPAGAGFRIALLRSYENY